MSNPIGNAIEWAEKELGILKADAEPLETSLLAWAHAFLVDITPVIKNAANAAVLAAVTVPGSGQVKALAAFTAASADLIAQGVPVIANDLKAAIQIAYKALPASITGSVAGQAVAAAATSEVDTLAAKV